MGLVGRNEIIMQFTMKARSTTYLLRIHRRSLFSLFREQRRKVNGNMPGYICEDLTSRFFSNGFQEINITAVRIVSKIILRTHRFLEACSSVCFLAFGLILI